jgi:hypothetical protein
MALVLHRGIAVWIWVERFSSMELTDLDLDPGGAILRRPAGRRARCSWTRWPTSSQIWPWRARTECSMDFTFLKSVDSYMDFFHRFSMWSAVIFGCSCLRRTDFPWIFSEPNAPWIFIFVQILMLSECFDNDICTKKWKNFLPCFQIHATIHS